MIRNGWQIYFIKRLFGKQRRDLKATVRQLKQTLPTEEYLTHSDVKLYTAIMVAIKEKIPADPYATHFALTGALKSYGRVKKMGLPNRYRLFFRALQTHGRQGDEEASSQPPAAIASGRQPPGAATLAFLFQEGSRAQRLAGAPDHKAIFILWLGYPRKEGDKNDCYKAFTKMVEKGQFPDSLDDLLLASEED